MKRPFRFWMSGCFAVVMAAAGGGRANALERGPDDDTCETRSSRFSAGETVQRIESCAARHGLTVFARVDAVTTRPGELAGWALIVFESARGGTPVLMAGPDSRPDLPLAIRVRGTAGGASEVWITHAGWDGLPDELARDLIELPALVDDALT